MNQQTIIALMTGVIIMLCASTYLRKADGWYPVAEYPCDSITGNPLALIKDFENIMILRDSFVNDGDTICLMFIQGRVKPDKRRQWADGTERLIGGRLGFFYKDSLITAPQVNTRIESGSFQINSSDSVLLKNIFNAIKQASNHE